MTWAGTYLSGFFTFHRKRKKMSVRNLNKLFRYMHQRYFHNQSPEKNINIDSGLVFIDVFFFFNGRFCKNYQYFLLLKKNCLPQNYESIKMQCL